MRFPAGNVPVLKMMTLILAVVALGACADTRGGSIPYNVSNFGRPDPVSASVLPADYAIAPMDTLSVKLYGDDTISGDYIVDLMGNISMPLIGDVHAAGLTPDQFRDVLKAKLGAKYYNHPDVTLAMKSSAGRNVTVDGAVSRGGAFPVLGSMTLMQAVALAGGTADDANAHRVAVFRTIDGQRQAAAFDLVSIRRGEMTDPPVYAGDIIVVDGSKIKATLKQIFQSTPLISLFRPFVL
jgi:polysaccharide export outer membrane protein